MTLKSMSIWLTMVYISLQLLPSFTRGDCVIEENSQVFQNYCNVKKFFPEIENPNIDNFQSFFRLNENNLELLQSLDRESLIQNQKCDTSKSYNYNSNGQCTLLLELSGSGPKFYQLPILVADVNDNTPSFDRLTYNFKIAENSPAHNEVELPLARDPDRGTNGTVIYELKRSKSSNKFVLITPSSSQGQDSSLKLKILQSFDRELDEDFQLVLIARDMGIPSLSSSLVIKIEITDVNDHAPQFNQSSYRFNSAESIVQGQSIGQVFATDKDITSRVTIMMSPSASSEIMDKFSVASDGVISTKVALVYVSSTFDYRIPISAIDSGSPTLTATTTVFVHVTDINDNRPIIEVASSNQNNRLVLTENCPWNSYIAKVTVSDKDYGINGQVECKLDNNYLFNLESIQNFENRRHYKLVTAPTSSFDRETKDNHQLNIICNDMGIPSLTSTRPITIVVKDENDNPPVFPNQHLTMNIPENQPSGTRVMRLKAIDKDIGMNAQTKYMLSLDSLKYFNIDAFSGVITSRHPFDREQESEFKVRGTAYDNLKSSMHSNVTIHITIIDENDNAPRFLKSFSFHIKENREGVLGRVEAVDVDIGLNAKVEYFLILPSRIFEISKNGEILVSHKIDLDRERTDHYTLEIGARDHGNRPLTSSTTVEIIVDDINDNSPTFMDPKPGTHLNVSIETAQGSKIYSVKAIDRDSGDNAKIVYSIHPQNLFFINSSEGSIFLNKSLMHERLLPEKLIIYAKDSGAMPRQAVATIHLNYLRNDKSKPTILGKRTEPKQSFPRDLVLSLGIGLVLLIFTCLLLLVTYFCASMIVQKRRHQRRPTNKDAITSAQHRNWFNIYCCCEPTELHHQNRECNKNSNIPISCTVDRQNAMSVCLNRWDKSKESGLDDDPLYSYREFTMKPLVSGNQTPVVYDRLMSVPRVVNPYWQYNTISNPNIGYRPPYMSEDQTLPEVVYHQGNAYLYQQSRPDLGDSNSSDEVNRIIYGDLSHPTLQNNVKVAVLPQSTNGESESEKMKKELDEKCTSNETLTTSKDQLFQPYSRYAGYVVGSPCYANSFV